jgi:hypothetical protein
MNESASLTKLLQKAFQMAGESVLLGFDVGRIQPTLAKLPGGTVTGLEPLFASVWPSDSFHLGRIELFGPERINYEHAELLPSCLVIKYGFLGIGSDGAGTIFSYCVDDKKVYLVPHEYVSGDAVYARPWTRLEPSAENIKAISEQTWDTLGLLFEWALAELHVIEAEGSS